MAIQQVNSKVQKDVLVTAPVNFAVQVRGQYRGESIILATPPGMNPNNLEEVSMFLAGKSQLKTRRIEETSHLLMPNFSVALANAAEELTFAAAEYKKPEEVLEEATEKTKSMQKNLDFESTTENVDSVLEKLTDLPKAELEKLVSQLIELRQGTPKEALTKFLMQFKEIAHQYAALLQAKETVSQTLDLLAGQKNADVEYILYSSQLNSEINNQLKEMVEEAGDQIRAGINVSPIAVKFVQEFELSQLGSLRELYRDCVLNYESLWDIYKKLTRKFGRKKFKKSCFFLEESLVADMESDGASIAREKLAAILADIYQLRILGQLNDESDVLYFRLKKKFLLNAEAQDDLGEGIIELFDGAITQSGIERKIEQVVGRIGMRHIAGRINLITGIKSIVRLIPLGIFRSDGERGRVLETIQKALDIAIERENNEHEA